jgi:hypothetical protein
MDRTILLDIIRGGVLFLWICLPLQKCRLPVLQHLDLAGSLLPVLPHLDLPAGSLQENWYEKSGIGTNEGGRTHLFVFHFRVGIFVR